MADASRVMPPGGSQGGRASGRETEKSPDSGGSLTTSASPPRRLYGATGKRILDVGLIVLFAPIWSILYVSIAALVLLGEGRPLYHRSVRVGQDGREIRVLKFRTMRRDAESCLEELLTSNASLAAQFRQSVKLRCDPRVTPVGRMLRRTSLDELPQLVNVLKGDMSLVGPRPVLQAELDQFYRSHAAEVLRVRPGLTGLWQVSGRSLLTYDERVAFDVEYVERCGLQTDLEILFRTIPTVARGHGAF